MTAEPQAQPASTDAQPLSRRARRAARPRKPRDPSRLGLGLRDGLLLVDKPSGCTSHDVVSICRRILRQKKIGHCGTLDPAATGLLLLTVGRATRLTRFLIRAPKVYEGTIRLGLETDTYDTTGETVAELPVEGLDDATIRRAMEEFVGTSMQSPPPYSAKKVGGVKFYELARRGEEVPDASKEITIFELELLDDYEPGTDLRFRLACTSGTYARSIAHELGKALGCGGSLASLRRTHIGDFELTDSATLDALRERRAAIDEAAGEIARREAPASDAAPKAPEETTTESQAADGDPPAASPRPTEANEREAIAGHPPGAEWVPFDNIQLPFGDIVADPQQERRIHHGQSVLFRQLEANEGDWVRILSNRQRFIAVGSVVERIGTGSVGVVQPKVVF